MKKFVRVLAMLLTVLMCVSLLPLGALAEETAEEDLLPEEALTEASAVEEAAETEEASVDEEDPAAETDSALVADAASAEEAEPVEDHELAEDSAPAEEPEPTEEPALAKGPEGEESSDMEEDFFEEEPVLDGDNNLYAEAVGDSEVYVAPGESATLQVSASCAEGEITYQWYDDDWNAIEGATSDTYVTGAMTAAAEYYCEVSDEYGSGVTVWFSVGIANNFSASAVGNSTVYVELNGSATLAVTATATDTTGITYQWYDGNWNEIEGAASASYTVSNVTGFLMCFCKVSDKYGNSTNVWFNVRISNNLSASAAGDNYVYVTPGDDVTVAVNASCTNGGLTYRWFRIDDTGSWNEIEGATSASYTFSNVTDYIRCSCEVRDEYDNTRDVNFYIYIDNEFSAEAVGDTDIYVSPGESATLQVSASCAAGEITYQWYDNNYDEIEGAASASYTVSNVTGRTYFHCRVSDQYNNYEDVWFYIYIDNDLYAEAVGDNYVYVSPGGSAALAVSASCENGEITYQWYDRNWNRIGGASSDSYTVSNVTSSVRYICEVSDEYGNSETVYFYVYVENHFSASISGGGYKDYNSSAVLSVKVSADDTSKVTYAWYRDNVIVSGATGSSLTVKVDGKAEYRCVVSDGYGNSQYLYSTIGVASQLIVTPGKQDFEVEYGKPVTLEVFAYTRSGNITYRWTRDDDSDTILSEASTCTIASVKERGGYTCLVQDDYGNQAWYYFSVAVDNGFSAEAEKSEVTVPSGGSATLQVNATAKSGELTYTWYQYGEKIEGADGPTYILENVTGRTWLNCTVQDAYGNTAYVGFQVLLEGQSTSYDYNNISVEPGETVTLTCPVGDAATTTYQWSWWTEDAEGYAWVDIDGAAGKTYTTPAITAGTQYRCHWQTNGAEDEGYVQYYVYVDNGFRLDLEGDYNRYVPLNSDVTMKVTPTLKKGSVTYTWSVDGKTDETATGSSITLKNVTKQTEVSCRGMDDYGNSWWINATIYPELVTVSGDYVRAQEITEEMDGWTYYRTYYNITVPAGGMANIAVTPAAGVGSTLSYAWYNVSVSGDEGGKIPWSGNSLIVPNVWETTFITLEVMDQDGDSVYFNFKLVPEGDADGWRMIDGKVYYYKDGKAVTGWKSIGGYWYFFNNDGTMVTDAWKEDSTGWCYLGSDGKMLTNTWKQDSKGWCWIGSSGYIVKSKWVQDGGAWYYLNDSGYMVTGWKQIGGTWYYFYSSGKMAANAWTKDSGGWYYMNGDGKITKNAWVKDSKGWLYMDKNGRITKNAWAKDSKGWCYLGSDGYMVTSKWQKDSKGWCYLGADGRMYISKWLQDGGSWYYLDDSGYMVTGWKQIGGTWYYFYSSGKMATGTVTISGKTYKFDSNGKWLG